MTGKRPLGISILAIVLFWLAIAALVLSLSAEAMRDLAVKWELVRAGALIYALCAMVAAVGLWRLRRWSYVAFLAWVASVILVGVWWPLVLPARKGSWWSALIWIAVVGVFAVPLARYIRRILPPTT